MSNTASAQPPFSRLVLATTNPGKVREMRELFADISVALPALDEFATRVDVDETGTTFAENAALKAVAQAKAIGCWTIAEDSGICVDALDGEPGIYSARMAGQQADDEQNNDLLLARMADHVHRGATYHCAMAVATPEGRIVATSEGCCRGRLRRDRLGENGFGYDPLFEIPEYHQTFGQLGDIVKKAISHRARAARQILPALRRFNSSFGC